jgi:ketosteroid isomerase-like protein
MCEEVTEQIIAAEEQLRLAMLGSDIKILDELLAPDLIFTDHLGQLVDKQADLEGHKSGVLKLASLETFDRHIIVKNNVAIVSVRIQLSGSYNGMPANGNFRFTRVWAQSSVGTWQIVAAHSGVIA